MSKTFFAKYRPESHHEYPPKLGGGVSFAERAFLAAVLFLPFLWIFVLQVGFTLTISEIMVVVTFVALCSAALVGRRRLRFPSIGWVFAAFGLIAVLSVLNAFRDVQLPLASDLRFAVGRNVPQLRSVTTLVLIAGALLTCYVTFNVISTTKKLRKALSVHLFTATLVSAYGLWQIFGYKLGVDTGLRFTEAVTGGIPRISPTTPEPLYFASYLTTTVPFALAFLLADDDAGRRGPPRVLLGFALIVQVLALVFCFSTGGLISGSIAIVMVIALMARQTPSALKRLGVLALVLFLALSAVSSLFGFATISSVAQTLHKIVEPENLSNRDRVETGEAALSMFRAHPFLGVGVGNYGFLYNDYRPLDARYLDFLAVVNNFYLEILAETGLIGFLSFVLALTVVAVWLRRAVKFARNSYTKTASIGLCGALAAITVQLSTFSAAYSTYIWVMLGLAAVLGERLARVRSQEEPGEQ